MESLHRVADRWDETAETLDTVARRVTQTDPPPPAFGIDAPGRLAEVGYALREQWLAAAVARQRETAELASRVGAAAAALRAAATGYADADRAARRRLTTEAE